jgi:RNA polymerase sigma-70 factor, ECF subfamily
MEEDLINRAGMGDHQAFQQLIEPYHLVVWRTACVLLADRTLAEDAMQEAWVDVWHGLSTFRPGNPFRPWLLKIVTNRCHKMVRGQQRSTLPLESVDPDTYSTVDDSLKHLLQQEAQSELQTVLATLPAEQQQVLELRFYVDLDLAEIALVTQSSLGTVKSRLYRGLDCLRSRLQKTFSIQTSGEMMG